MKRHSLLLALALLMAWLLPTGQTLADTVTGEQLSAAYDAITDASNLDADGELWFHIYTTTVSSSGDKLYLTDKGTLTTDEYEASAFHFIPVDDSFQGFALLFDDVLNRAFHVKSNAGYFTNANKSTGSNIRTSSNSRSTYEAQVFFLGSNGYYAVRSTNALAGTWWESAWWTVANTESGAVTACYTEPDADDYDIQNAQFIWQIEKTEATDAISFDETATYNVAFAQMASGATYKYLLSPSFYDAVGYDDLLLHRTNVRSKQMQLTITPADNGKKNNFVMKDQFSGYYVTPAHNSGNGSEWTFGEEPAVVVLEMSGAADTYVMKGETGGKANPWGNDTEPYTVANYNGSNNVTITLGGTDNEDLAGFGQYIQPAYDAISAGVEDPTQSDVLWYRIFTTGSATASDGSPSGEKYYLTADGKLSTQLSDAATFNFVGVGEVTQGISEMAFFVKNGARCFTNANKATGSNIRTATNSRDTYEAQIFCLKDGRYAVRSTNAAPGGWWEASWWTVSAGSDTQAPTACYTEPANENAAYIWQLEKAEAVDDAIHFEEGRYYSVTANKNINYKYLQSPAYNADGDRVLRRTTDTEKMMKVAMTEVEGQKNAFTMQDQESGLYVIPAENAANGTNWTVGEEPQTVIFSEISTGVYTLKGTAGGYANAYGDDGEANGFRVANYGTPTQWIFTRQKSDDDINEELLEQQRMAYSDIVLDETYRIFTTAVAGNIGTRFYLTSSGTLTADEEQAAGFTLLPVGDNDGFSNYAFFVKHGASYFTNANKAEGESLRTSTNGRPTYDAQVFYLGDNYKYAVRSTNAYAGAWWEDAWWTTGTDAEGNVTACYTQPGDENRVYIWEMEVADPTDIIRFDSEVEYTVTLKKDINYRYLQSFVYNDEGDDVLRRTEDADKAMKVRMEAQNEKNCFTMQDMQSGLYITPAADAASATDWTLGSKPADIYLEQLDANTFTLKGSAGGYANAFGDDNAAQGYRVANYGTASQWIIAVPGEDNAINEVCTADKTADSTFYNLAGQRILTPHTSHLLPLKKGLYIHNGKKLFVK